MGWSFNWASSHESDFNFDLGVSAGRLMTHDPACRSRPTSWPWRCHRLPAALGAGIADDRNPEADRRLGYDRRDRIGDAGVTVAPGAGDSSATHAIVDTGAVGRSQSVLGVGTAAWRRC